MSTFEAGFSSIERALDDVDRRLRELQAQSRKLRGAARNGDLRPLRDGRARIAQTESQLAEAIDRANAAWPFDETAEVEYLRGPFAAELVAAAAASGVEIHDSDGRLLAFPALLRIDAAGRRVRLNNRQSSSLRPSAIVAALQAIRAKGDGFNAQAFANMLYRAWRVHTKHHDQGVRQVGLVEVHETLTLLPAARKDYDLTDFGRDLLLLDESGVRTVTADKATHTLSLLRASTSSKGGRYVRTVDRGGAQVGYAAIDFRSASA